MMPQLLRLQLQQPHHRPVRLWIPVLPLLVLLSPVLLLALLVAAVACLAWRIDPFRALLAAALLLGALKGTRVEVEQSDIRLLLDIR